MAGETDTRIKEGRRMGRWVEGGGNDEMERKGGAGCGWMDGKMPSLSCCDYYDGYYCVGRREAAWTDRRRLDSRWKGERMGRQVEGR